MLNKCIMFSNSKIIILITWISISTKIIVNMIFFHNRAAALSERHPLFSQSQSVRVSQPNQVKESSLSLDSLVSHNAFPVGESASKWRPGGCSKRWMAQRCGAASSLRPTFTTSDPSPSELPRGGGGGGTGLKQSFLSVEKLGTLGVIAHISYRDMMWAVSTV